MGLSENFIDRVELYVKSGDGGNGIVHFRHEKYVEKGGPDGGNGGNGGNVVFRINNKLSTLNNLRYLHHVTAENGQNGGERNSSGRNGQDFIIEVPEGTIIYDKSTNEKLFDLIDNKEYIIKGGRGGLGNTNFKSPTNQAPRYAQNGQKGIKIDLVLELSVMADVGFVGLPNAGKSTLLSILTNAKPKIGDYPFTTLTPQLGILKYKENIECTIADIPGLIEDSSKGKGLGIRFLQHIRRIKVVVYVVDIESDIDKSLKILQKELNNFDNSILEKRSLICISKIDKLENIDKNDKYIYISSFTREGIQHLKDEIFKTLSHINKIDE